MSGGLLVTCAGVSDSPHSQTVVFAHYSPRLRAWVYECSRCRYDVRVPDGHRPGLERQFAELDLHHLANLMAARRQAQS